MFSVKNSFMVPEHATGDWSTERMVEPYILRAEYRGRGGGRGATLLASEGKTPKTPKIEMITEENNHTAERAGVDRDLEAAVEYGDRSGGRLGALMANEGKPPQGIGGSGGG